MYLKPLLHSYSLDALFVHLYLHYLPLFTDLACIIICPMEACHFHQMERIHIIPANTILCDRTGIFNNSLCPRLGIYAIKC